MFKIRIVLFSLLCTCFIPLFPSHTLAQAPLMLDAQLGSLGTGLVAAWSPDGTSLALATTTGIWHYPSLTSEPQLLVATEPRLISALAFNADDTRLAYSGTVTRRDERNDYVTVNILAWLDLTTGEEHLLGEANWNGYQQITYLGFSLDSQSLFAHAGTVTTLQAWDLQTGSVESLAPADQDLLNAPILAFDPAQQQAVVLNPIYNSVQGRYENQLILWDVLAQQGLATIRADSINLNFWNGVLLPDQQLFAYSHDTRAEETTLFLWNTATGEEQTLTLPYYRIKQFALSSDGSQVTVDYDSGRGERGLSTWAVATGEKLAEFVDDAETTLAYEPNELAYHPQGDSLLISSSFGMFAWDFKTPPQPILSRDFYGKITLNTEGALVAIVQGNHALIWDHSSRTVDLPHANAVQSMLFSPNSRFLVTVDGKWNYSDPSQSTYALHLWDLRSHQELATEPLASSPALFLNTDGRLVTITNQQLTVWDMSETGLSPHASAELEGSPFPSFQRRVYLYEEGHSVALFGASDTLEIWNILTAQRLESHTLEGLSLGMDALIAQDYLYVAHGISDSSTGMINDYYVSIINWRTGEVIGEGSPSHVVGVCGAVAAGSTVVYHNMTWVNPTYGSITVFEGATQSSQTLPNVPSCSGLGFSPDGQVFITALEGQLTLWKDWQPFALSPQHSVEITSFAISENGHRVGYITADGIVRLWSIP